MTVNYRQTRVGTTSDVEHGTSRIETPSETAQTMICDLCSESFLSKIMGSQGHSPTNHNCVYRGSSFLPSPWALHRKPALAVTSSYSCDGRNNDKRDALYDDVLVKFYSFMKKEAAGSFETFLPIWRHIPHDCSLII